MCRGGECFKQDGEKVGHAIHITRVDLHGVAFLRRS
jgi:hypothetical protein